MRDFTEGIASLENMTKNVLSVGGELKMQAPPSFAALQVWMRSEHAKAEALDADIINLLSVLASVMNIRPKHTLSMHHI